MAVRGSGDRMKTSFEIRTMRREDLELAVDWAAQEGWNPGLHDTDCFYPVDMQGFYMAFVDGKPVGSVSAVAYDDHFGFIGFFIVLSEFRGGSIGVALGRKALEHLGGRNIGIDGVEKKIKNYMSHGFTLAHNNIRYEGVSVRGECAKDVVAATQVAHGALVAFDRRFFPASRPEFLVLWGNQPNCVSMCAMDGGNIAGLATARVCRRGYKIGPLFAESPEVAMRLLDSITSCLPSGTPFFLDIPAVNAPALAMAAARHMKPVFNTARMYSKEAPPLPLDKIFGITSFELG